MSLSHADQTSPTLMSSNVHSFNEELIKVMSAHLVRSGFIAEAAHMLLAYFLLAVKSWS
jgi:hypothetical protein